MMAFWIEKESARSDKKQQFSFMLSFAVRTAPIVCHFTVATPILSGQSFSLILSKSLAKW